MPKDAVDPVYLVATIPDFAKGAQAPAALLNNEDIYLPHPNDYPVAPSRPLPE
jgi:hypothetical protein